MRPAIATILLWCSVVGANPTYKEGPAYIAYEQLSVQLSATEARFAGRFVFRTVATDAATERKYNGSYIEIPVWFPLKSESDPTVTNFWAVFKREGGNSITTFQQRAAFERGIGMTVIIGNKPHHSIGGFQAMLGRDELLPDLPADPDFCRVVCGASLAREDIKNGLPVTLRYRQPLSQCPEGARFYYVPIFKNLPRGFTSGNTKVYGITLTACSNCAVSLTYGARELKIEPGRSITLSPADMKPIQALVTGANPQRGADESQPSGSPTNRTPAAAGSRGSR